MKIAAQKLSSRYKIRALESTDIKEIYSLCVKNTLFYTHCPPLVTEERIIKDMNDLPKGRTMSDKYYLGYYDGEKLIAVLDLISGYPDEKTAFIGFFMLDISVQKRGIGSKIIDELCFCLRETGFKRVRLCWNFGNPQAEHFWRKNGFRALTETDSTDGYHVIPAEKDLL